MLDKDWDGVAIFKAAFSRVLPQADAPKYMKVLDMSTTLKSLAEPFIIKKTRRARRGSGFTYTSGPNRYNGRAGTWGAYMVRTVLAHTSSWDAESAHLATGEYPEKRLDFNWMINKQYITRS